MKYITNSSGYAFKVCILAAGVGSRNLISKNTHKALLPINYKAVISHIIELYPKKTDFIIAVNHNAKLIIDYLKLAKPNHRLKFVKIKKIIGPGSGPGRSLLECKRFLQCPFIFHSCDTLIKNSNIPLPKFNWIGFDLSTKNKDYVSLDKSKNKINFFISNSKRSKAFIGLSGIKDYQLFWKSLANSKFYSQQINKKQKKNFFEKQTIDGFSFINQDLMPIKFKWFDTGNDKTYLITKNKFEKNKKNFTSQKDEFLYFENNKVIKLFKNKQIPKNKIIRSRYIKKYLPNGIANNNYYLSYNFIKGDILMNVKNKFIFKNVINKLFDNFWKKKKLNNKEKNIFLDQCFKFYKNKTYKRVNLFLKELKSIDSSTYINNRKVPKIKKLLNNIHWQNISIGVPTNFHGDTSLNNIIIKNKKSLKLIDWRDCFGKLIKYGDLYYDLAKVYHSLTLSHKHFNKNFHKISINKSKISIRLKKIKYLETNLKIFSNEILRRRLDLNKVKLLSWIQLLNSAAVNSNRSVAIIYFTIGKLFLFNEINKNKINMYKNYETSK